MFDFYFHEKPCYLVEVLKHRGELPAGRTPVSREVVEDQILVTQKHCISEVQRGHKIIKIARGCIGCPVSLIVSLVTFINVRTQDLNLFVGSTIWVAILFYIVRHQACLCLFRTIMPCWVLWTLWKQRVRHLTHQVTKVSHWYILVIWKWHYCSPCHQGRPLLHGCCHQPWLVADQSGSPSWRYLQKHTIR